MQSILLLATVLTAIACGKSEDTPPPAPDNTTSDSSDAGAEEGSGSENSNLSSVEVVRGSWDLKLSNDNSKAFSIDAGSNAPIAGTVAAAATFVIDANNFVAGTGTGVTSYGTLDVTQLRDNSLRVCGVSSNARCTTAVIRIYTVGTPAAGLWSTVELVGLPILNAANVIGLNVAGAVNIITYTIPANLATLKLSNLSPTAIKIPVAVDFTDAAAGTYSSTMRVEYILK